MGDISDGGYPRIVYQTAAASGRPAYDYSNPYAGGQGESVYVYDGDGRRVKKTENGQTILYVNKYYEKNLTTGEVITYYYLGDTRVAMRKGASLHYMQQDHLSGTSLVSDSTGSQVGATMKYYPFGGTRSGSVPTDLQFTGQRLDGTGLYYYNARYYDPEIGRFISADTFVQQSTDFNTVAGVLTVNMLPSGVYPKNGGQAASNPQALNRYTYTLNNPVRYTDPNGWWAIQLCVSREKALLFGGETTFSVAIDSSGNIGFFASGGIGGGAKAASGTTVTLVVYPFMTNIGKLPGSGAEVALPSTSPKWSYGVAMTARDNRGNSGELGVWVNYSGSGVDLGHCYVTQTRQLTKPEIRDSLEANSRYS